MDEILNDAFEKQLQLQSLSKLNTLNELVTFDDRLAQLCL
ncbi:unnamed protein product, partial [Adineta steineri]